MLYPSINELLERVDSRYTLVVVVAKRARKIIDEDKSKTESCTKNRYQLLPKKYLKER